MLWRAEKVWRRPKAAKILIYDRCGSETLLGYLRKDDVEILDVRGESINIYVLMKCILSFDLSGASYANKYIAAVQPSVILTFIDNDARFYELKHANPKAATVFLQNGWRTEGGDVFGYLKESAPNKDYQVDYMLTFGAAAGKKYREYINGQVIPIGSVKCNLYQLEKNTDRPTLAFISQYTVPPPGGEHGQILKVADRLVAWKDFYAAERKVIGFLARYCEKKQLALQVCGRSPDSAAEEEYEFFRALIGDKKWEFIPRDGLRGSYHSIDRAALVVGIDSTLVYESLARGKKTAVFSIRSELTNDSTAKFGWPGTLPESGPFWTNRADESTFERILDYLVSVSGADWEKTRAAVVPDLMEYDPGNTRFLSLMRKLDVRLNDQYIFHVQR